MSERVIKGAVLGSPIKHSLSPLLHSTAYKFLGIEGQYSAIEVNSGGLSNFLENFISFERGFKGSDDDKKKILECLFAWSYAWGLGGALE